MVRTKYVLFEYWVSINTRLSLFENLWFVRFTSRGQRFGPNTRSKENRRHGSLSTPLSQNEGRRIRDVCWRVNIYRRHDDNNRVLTTRVPAVSFVNTISWNVVCRNNPPPASKPRCLNRKLEYDAIVYPFPFFLHVCLGTNRVHGIRWKPDWEKWA